MSAGEALLKKAIEAKKIITFHYEGCNRIAAPHHYGILNEKIQLHAFQVGGESNTEVPIGWKNFEINKIQKLFVNDDTFQVRKDHNPGNSNYSVVHKSVT